MTLSDVEIEIDFREGKLVLNPDMEMLEGACYQLRMGSVYYDLTEASERFELSPGDKVLVKPGHRVVLITAEELNIPSNVLARVVSKGSLFSIGLSPVATYADPGFSGNMGIVTQNVSDRYIEIPQGLPIAKADFSLLSSSASRVYEGQHGFKDGIWPIEEALQKGYQEVRHDRRVRSEKEEALALLPEATRAIIRRMESTQLWTNAGLVIAILINSAMIFLVQNQLVSGMIGMIGSLAAAGVIALASLSMTLLRRNA